MSDTCEERIRKLEKQIEGLTRQRDEADAGYEKWQKIAEMLITEYGALLRHRDDLIRDLGEEP
jgi:hypothetical protein